MPKRGLARLATVSVAALWLTAIFMAGFIVVGVATNMQGEFVIHTAIRGPLVIITFGLVYVAVALSTRCPHCGYRFLMNPKGLGPRGFVYHPSFARGPGISPWARQIIRLLRTGNIRCIHCGQEVFSPSQPA